MQVKPRNGRFARGTRKAGHGTFHSNEGTDNRFNALASLGEADKRKRGNPRTGPTTKHLSNEVTKTKASDGKKEHKAGPASGKDKAPAPISAKPRPTAADHSRASSSDKQVDNAESSVSSLPDTDSSIFASPAYKELHHTTSLGPTHSAVTLTTSHEGNVTNCVMTGPHSFRPNQPVCTGKQTFPPRPPDRHKPKKTLHINSITKFKVTKPRLKESFGSPSEGLNKALVDALGQSIGSDEEMQFAEANEVGFEDSASDQSENES